MKTEFFFLNSHGEWNGKESLKKDRGAWIMASQTKKTQNNEFSDPLKVVNIDIDLVHEDNDHPHE